MELVPGSRTFRVPAAIASSEMKISVKTILFVYFAAKLQLT